MTPTPVISARVLMKALRKLGFVEDGWPTSFLEVGYANNPLAYVQEE